MVVLLDLHTQPNYLNGLLENEKYLRTILDATQDAFIAIHNNTIIDANQAFYDKYGYTAEDLNRLSMMDLIPEAWHQQAYEKMDRLLAFGSDVFESQNRRRDGLIIDVEISSVLVSRTPLISVCFMRDITERKIAEKRLSYWHGLMRYIIEHNRNAVAMFDCHMNYMFVSRPYVTLFELEEQEIIGRCHYEVFPELSETLRANDQKMLQNNTVASGEDEVPETGRVLAWESRPWYEESGQIGGILLYIEDVTEHRRLEAQLLREKEQLKTTLLSVGDGVIATDTQGLVTMMNPVAERLTGWPSSDGVGRHLREIVRLSGTRSHTELTAFETLLNGEFTGDFSTIAKLLGKDGRELPVELSLFPIRGSESGVTGAVLILRDYTEKLAKQEQIEFLSFNDVLTGLYNRRYMEQAMRRLDTPENLPISLIAIDVNGLKLTNDAFGHEMGDLLLKAVAELLKSVCRPQDVAGRMGGDEFTIVLTNTDETQAAALKRKLLDDLTQLKADPIVVSLAIGYATKVSPQQDMKAVMVTADNDMYQDKIKYGKVMRNQTIQLALNNIHQNYAQEQCHTEKVSQYCEAIAQAMALSAEEIRLLKSAGALHDIGKIMVPAHVLNKPDKLTAEEFELVKRHPEIGYQMLKTVDEYAVIAEYVLYHHERLDGTGYPLGLKGQDIPLFARIIALADAYEAMTADRPYQVARTKAEAIEELKRCAGTQFDPQLVTIFVEKVLNTSCKREGL